MENPKHASDVLFILLGAIMILAMHAGFAFLELGTVRHKNQVNALVKIMVDFAVSTLAYFFKGEVNGIKEIMKRSRELGMQTFDQALFDLYEAGTISYEDALRNADSLNDLRLQIKLHGQEAKDRNVMSGIEHLGIVQ